MPQDNITIAKRMYEAYTKKDRAQIESLLDKDFHFSSPLDNRIDFETYMERCWPNAKNAGEFRYIHLVPDGPRVFVTYESKTLDGKMFRNTEILTFKDKKAVEAEVYFGWDIPHKAEPGSFISDQEKPA